MENVKNIYFIYTKFTGKIFAVGVSHFKWSYKWLYMQTEDFFINQQSISITIIFYHCGLVTPYNIPSWVNIGSCNGVLRDGIKLLHERMFIFNQWSPVEITQGQFHPAINYRNELEIILVYNLIQSSQGQWVNWNGNVLLSTPSNNRIVWGNMPIAQYIVVRSTMSFPAWIRSITWLRLIQ